jgi:hypothetical protein
MGLVTDSNLKLTLEIPIINKIENLFNCYELKKIIKFAA